MAIQTNLKATKIDMTDALEEYLTKRVRKLDQFIDDEDTSAIADIELAKVLGDQRSGDIYRAEINLHISGAYLYAASEKDDLRAAIDAVKDQMVREIKEEKEKKETLMRKGARKMKQMLRNIYSSKE
jgi:putative sigma-54 modulation protein